MQVGDKIGRYTLEEQLGRGTYGLAFRARDDLVGADLCLKLIHPHLSDNERILERFRRELLIARRVTHANVCRVYDFGQSDDGLAYMTMELVDGVSLSSVLADDAPLPWPRTLRLMSRIAEGLAAAHDLGVIHRDLKPGNVLVKEGDDPVILDFGMATAFDLERITQTGAVVGTPSFIAPEVWAGTPAVLQSDIWALGVMLYIATTGELPFGQLAPLQMLDAIRRVKPRPPSERVDTLPPALDDVVARCMELQPQDRYADARAFREALVDAESTEEIRISPHNTTRDMRSSMVDPDTRLQSAEHSQASGQERRPGLSDDLSNDLSNELSDQLSKDLSDQLSRDLSEDEDDATEVDVADTELQPSPLFSEIARRKQATGPSGSQPSVVEKTEVQEPPVESTAIDTQPQPDEGSTDVFREGGRGLHDRSTMLIEDRKGRGAPTAEAEKRPSLVWIPMAAAAGLLVLGLIAWAVLS